MALPMSGKTAPIARGMVWLFKTRGAMPPFFSHEENMIHKGDTVRFSENWLRSCGLITGSLPFAIGVVTAAVPMKSGHKICSVRWDDPGLPKRVLSSNLEVIHD